MPIHISKAQIATALQQNLEENNVASFRDYVRIAAEVGADLNQPYGRESGFKTILHLALEEEDGEPYVRELLRHGAKADLFNAKAGSCPIHVAAAEALPDIMRQLFHLPNNRANVNAADRDGLTAFHILLSQLVDLSSLESKPLSGRGSHPPTDDDIEQSMANVLDCLQLVASQNDFNMDLDVSLAIPEERTKSVKSILTIKKLGSMTPLQVICSFQTWNAKPISDMLHAKVQSIVEMMLDLGADPNGTAAKGAIPGSVPGSTPPVLLAATRGYYLVIDVFKRYYGTNFLIENKFRQNILHITLKAGYYNKIVVHGNESGDVNIRTLHSLLSDSTPTVRNQMRTIINDRDRYGNTALHYVKPYPDQEAVKLLLKHGAKVEKNPQGIINVVPRTLEEFFSENCITTEGDDIDDEDFKIVLNYQFFEKPLSRSKLAKLSSVGSGQSERNAWSSDSGDVLQLKPVEVALPGTGRVDTKRLKYFADTEHLHNLLRHPVVSSFLELELNSLRLRYFLDFLLYLVFVIVLFFFLSEEYGLNSGSKSDIPVIYTDTSIGYNVTYSLVILCVLMIFLVLREFYQMYRWRKRYFTTMENYIEWCIIVLVILNIIPWYYITFLGNEHLQRHLAALTLLIAFIQLYLVLIRVVPNTPIPLYINYFTTVLKTYTLLLLSYMAFILSFSYSFYIIFSPQNELLGNGTTIELSTGPTTAEVGNGEPNYSDFGLSLVKTITMFVGEFNYDQLQFSHWLGYVIYVSFIYLIVIVLANILNALAVQDISNIMEEMENYHNVSIVETLSYTSFVSLLAQEVTIAPNVRAENQKFLGIPIPGYKVHRAVGGKRNSSKKSVFFLSESVVKAAKELVAAKTQPAQSDEDVTLESLGEGLADVKREQVQLKQKLLGIEDSLKTLVEIMISRHPPVERL